MRAPTATELLNDPMVQQVLDQAWADSLPADPARRHEEGGWIYINGTTGQITIRRATSGGQSAIDLNDPPHIGGSLVVGKFHTHPNPTAEGWNPGPSDTDLRVDTAHGVPDLIRADNGVHRGRRAGWAG
jgi:hypothetical protein